MRRTPRNPAEPPFSRPMIAWGLLQGALALALIASIFVVGLQRGMSEDDVRALTFFSLITSIIALIFANRTTSGSLFTAFLRTNRTLTFVLSIVAATVAMTLLWPVASGLFRFGSLHIDDLATTLGAGVALLVLLELLWRIFFSHRAYESRAKVASIPPTSPIAARTATRPTSSSPERGI